MSPKLTITSLHHPPIQEVPDELLELPYNASDSRHSLHNGNGGPLMTTSSNNSGSNGTIIMVPTGGGGGSAGSASHADCEDGYYQPVIDDTGQSAMIKIDVPTEVSRDEPRFPKEKMKTFYCECLLLFFLKIASFDL